MVTVATFTILKLKMHDRFTHGFVYLLQTTNMAKAGAVRIISAATSGKLHIIWQTNGIRFVSSDQMDSLAGLTHDSFSLKLKQGLLLFFLLTKQWLSSSSSTPTIIEMNRH